MGTHPCTRRGLLRQAVSQHAQCKKRVDMLRIKDRVVCLKSGRTGERSQAVLQVALPGVAAGQVVQRGLLLTVADGRRLVPAPKHALMMLERSWTYECTMTHAGDCCSARHTTGALA